MTVVELHPEELLDRLEEGVLTGPERLRLDAHLSTCSVCRFEVAVRKDLTLEAAAFDAGPPRLERSLETELAAPVPAKRPSRAPRRRLPVWLFGLAAALVAGGALAGAATGVLKFDFGALSSSPADALAEEPSPTTPPTKSARTVASRSRPGAELAVVAQDVVALAPPVAPGVDAVAPMVREPPAPAPLDDRAVVRVVPGVAPRSSLAAASSRPRTAGVPVAAARVALPVAGTDFPSASPTAAPSRPAAVPASAMAPSTAADLFAAANRARGAGDVGTAIQGYRLLAQRFPTSEEAGLARATIAKLELDRGDARSALAGFDDYLGRGEGPLGEEALVGRAMALGQLARPVEEAAAWRDVLRRFPASMHAARARARLAVLGSR